MTEQELYAELTDVFRDVFDDPNIVLFPEMTAKDVEGWDSSNHINLVLGAEAKFGLRFNIAEIEALRTVGDFVGLIGARLPR
jgi:acyl carrier protein